MPDWLFSGSCFWYLWLAINALALIYFFFGQPDDVDDPEFLDTSVWDRVPSPEHKRLWAETKRQWERKNEKTWEDYHRNVRKAKWEDLKERWGCLGWLLTGWLVYFTFRYMVKFYGIG